ncbi:MSHA biogenesis protein MshA [Shewanella sp. OPT22]|nr:MSHA biogenesis protein MshA [Shewanella sp. OPT22]
MKKNNNGFTLIELVVVIIILGILAVVAAPKFINFQGDARVSTLKGLQGSINSANALVLSKAALSGDQKKSSANVVIATDTSTDPDTNTSVSVKFGHMDRTLTNFQKALDLSISAGNDPQATTINTDWIYEASTGKFWQAGSKSTCFITYTEATATASAKFAVLPASTAC